MTTDTNIIVMIIVYMICIILIPLFLDYLFRLTIRSKRRLAVKNLAQKKAKATGKPLVVFNSKSNGVVSQSGDLDSTDTESFECDINQCISALKENSVVLVVSETLEYVPNVEELLNSIRTASGGDFYIIGLEKNSPRIFYDYKIKNIMSEPFYIPGSSAQIKWSAPNPLQKSIQDFYSIIFKVLPYDFFTTDPFVKAKKIETNNT